MDQDRAIQPSGFLQNTHHGRNIVAIHRPQIGNVHLLENHAGNHELFDAALGPADAVHQMGTDTGDLGERLGDILLEIVVAGRRPQITEGQRDAAGVFGDRHVVVIENDNEIALQPGGVVQRLEGHTAGQGAVPDHGDHVEVLSPEVPGSGEPQPRRDRSGAVAGVERVALALSAPGKARDPPVGADAVEVLPPAGEYLVGVGLMPDVPDQLVLRQVEYEMQGHGELHHAHVGGQMAPCAADLLQNERTDLLRQFRVVPGIDLLDVIRMIDLF